MSLSMVPGIPIQGMPFKERARAPMKEPSPPMMTRPSIPSSLQTPTACICPSSVLNSLQRAVSSMVPPRCSTFETERMFISDISPLINPLYPLRIPMTCIFFLIAVLTTARTAAFIPGASPPLVKTPMTFWFFSFIKILHFHAGLPTQNCFVHRPFACVFPFSHQF